MEPTDYGITATVDRLIRLSDEARRARKLEHATVYLDLAESVLRTPPCKDDLPHIWDLPWQSWTGARRFFVICAVCNAIVSGGAE